MKNCNDKNKKSTNAKKDKCNQEFFEIWFKICGPKKDDCKNKAKHKKQSKKVDAITTKIISKRKITVKKKPKSIP
ncbi:MAG: hypothetical protein PUE01_01475 [Clostridiaceae bacterium]|nr:hypothetical protein [Clostridiaceae bacterium]